MLIMFLGGQRCYRSFLSEAVFNHYAPEGFEAISAAAGQADTLDPRVIALLERYDISSAGLFDTTWHEVWQQPDVIVTVSSGINTDNCPLNLRSVLHTHWGDDDPWSEDGTDQELDQALTETIEVLQLRLQAFQAYAHDELRRYPYKLAAALEDIGMLGASRAS